MSCGRGLPPSADAHVVRICIHHAFQPSAPIPINIKVVIVSRSPIIAVVSIFNPGGILIQGIDHLISTHIAMAAVLPIACGCGTSLGIGDSAAEEAHKVRLIHALARLEGPDSDILRTLSKAVDALDQGLKIIAEPVLAEIPGIGIGAFAARYRLD